MFGNRRQQIHPKTTTWICWEMRTWKPFLVHSQILRVLLTIYVPSTPGTALQQKIESKLEKSLGSQFNIQLQQQMGAFQASLLEAMKSLRDEMQSIRKSANEVELDQSSTSTSKPGPSKQSDNLPRTLLRTLSPNVLMKPWSWTCMVLLCLHGSEMLKPNMAEIRTTVRITTQIYPNNPNRCVGPEPKNIWTNANTRFRPNISLSRHPQRGISPLLTRKGLLSPLGPFQN